MKINFTKELVASLVDNAMSVLEEMKLDNQLSVTFDHEGATYTGVFHSPVPGKIVSMQVYLEGFPLFNVQVLPSAEERHGFGNFCTPIDPARHKEMICQSFMSTLLQIEAQCGNMLNRRQKLQQQLHNAVVSGVQGEVVGDFELDNDVAIGVSKQNHSITYTIYHKDAPVAEFTLQPKAEQIHQLMTLMESIIAGLPVEEAGFEFDTDMLKAMGAGPLYGMHSPIPMGQAMGFPMAMTNQPYGTPVGNSF